MGVVTTYVAAAEGTRDAGLRAVARRRLMRVAEYLAAHGHLMVMPAGGLAARGPGDALPALEWPFRHAIVRATGQDLSGLATASFQQGLERAGIWELFRGPTDRAMAASWIIGLTIGSPFLVALEAVLAGWGAVTFAPKFLTPGDIGFVAGIASSRDGFDVSNDAAAAGMALAALLHAWAPEPRFRNYAEIVGGHTGAGAPYSTGFLPYLGFLAGEDDPSTNVAYARWYSTRQGRGVDSDDYSATCFAAAVAVLLGPTRNVVQERALVDRLNNRHDKLAAFGAAAIVQSSDITDAVDYLAALALAWRYRQEHDAAGDPIDTAGFPEVPSDGVAWPEPGVPRTVVETLPDWVPVRAIQGSDPLSYNSNGEAPLFTAGSPTRPPVSRPNLTFPANEPLIYDESFLVTPGPELFTGIVLQWGDRWEVTADGNLTVGGGTFGPDGATELVWDARFPMHCGRDVRATEHCLLVRLNNYILVGHRRPNERWLYPDETFLHLRLNQLVSSGTGGFTTRVRVRGSRRPTQRLLEVSCAERPAHGSDRRIKAIGGVHRDGAHWTLTISEALAAIVDGQVFFIHQPGIGAQEIMAIRREPHHYLRARADPSMTNNLASLPRCAAN